MPPTVEISTSTEGRFVSLARAAKILDVAPRTALKACRAGRVKTRQLPGGCIRQYLRSDVERLAAESWSTEPEPERERAV